MHILHLIVIPKIYEIVLSLVLLALCFASLVVISKFSTLKHTCKCLHVWIQCYNAIVLVSVCFAGVQSAYRAYRKYINLKGPDPQLPDDALQGFTGDQLFLLGFARVRAISWQQLLQLLNFVKSRELGPEKISCFHWTGKCGFGMITKYFHTWDWERFNDGYQTPEYLKRFNIFSIESSAAVIV